MFNGFDLSTISDAKFGNTQINQIYYGSQLIWPTGPQHDYSQDYLTFEVLENGSIGYVESITTAGPDRLNRTIYYKINNGSWTSITSQSTPYIINVNQGDIVLIKGNNYSYGYEPNKITGTVHFDFFCNCNISGNIMSLIYGDNFINNTAFPDISLCNRAFGHIFENNYDGYSPSFIDGITYYRRNIINTNNLVLPATTLVSGCYQKMFDNCQNMITTPRLPATILATNCCAGMFSNCKSLTVAPDLLATNLISNVNGLGCYSGMFDGCSNLNYIKCLATTKVDNYDQWKYTQNWVNNVAASGTFVKDTNTQWWPTGDDGIPSGWTVQNA